MRHIHDLMALAVGATRDAAEAAQAGGLRAAKLQALKNDIAGCLDQPNLSVTTLAARHAMTPRFIQRLFEAEGTTFTEYLLDQRLARAQRALTEPHRVGDKISTIAWDCGFGDVSYFNRVFRRRYTWRCPRYARRRGGGALHRRQLWGEVADRRVARPAQIHPPQFQECPREFEDSGRAWRL